MKRRIIYYILPFLFTSLLVSFLESCKTKETESRGVFEEYNFLVSNDNGRNGYYEHKAIAEQMGNYTEKMDIEFVAAVGDIHHFEGVASVSDPLWLTNYELIYPHPGLMIDWFANLGNHEYRGNTQACIDYSGISRRWNMPDRYYTKVMEVDDSTTLRLLFVDTSPMIDKYRKDTASYPDAVKQDLHKQLQFIDSVLSVTDETWTVVFGHHPAYAYTTKSESERLDIQSRLDPLLRKHNVDFYFSGHIHNFQHIRKDDSPVHYIVNSSASRSRPVQNIDGTVFCDDRAGFSVCSVSNKRFSVNFIDSKGKVIYTYSKEKSGL
jgi:hypothetical protein